jgi:RNA polymerase sigma factor (TIGR02999 family)
MHVAGGFNQTCSGWRRQAAGRDRDGKDIGQRGLPPIRLVPPILLSPGFMVSSPLPGTRERSANLLTVVEGGKLDPTERELMRAVRTTTDLSALLTAWGRGDVAARDQLMPLVYEELRRRARAGFRREHVGHALQPTALVHEAYLRLIKQDRIAWKNRAQFYGVAAQMMRRILVDHARARTMPKRSGQWARVSLVDIAAQRQPHDVEDLHAALEELASFDPRKSQVAELRFFGGLSLEETGHVLNLSIATVEREWPAARAWLYSRLRGSCSS